jgi:hypothetical protein
MPKSIEDDPYGDIVDNKIYEFDDFFEDDESEEEFELEGTYG